MGNQADSTGWLYNVSGLNAVEIQLTSGRTYRIGTDEPQKLLAAIETACKSRDPAPPST